jgi:hypothetical protein
MGGYLARGHDPPPGNTVMWRGLTRLMDIELGAKDRSTNLWVIESFVERIRAKAAESSRILAAKAQRIVDEHDRCLAQITDPKLKASALRR